jgi:pyruvate/2-oxoglutarate dehydrogenase complex dihydrolipoamide acyltransferase (E2) component
VAAEVPGTLLLAEAFWMMEGYFVRTLGMHRVYNSAFMNLLRDEDNQHYRGLLKQTMEFDPGIMKRYVNFMSNPDERTAIDQFGTGDKCFGIATMMATLPGLPMFGHGQVEGFTEKYGMEYQRPRYDETPNQWLVDRHNREIAPLLHSRWLFAESDNFLLYDFWKEDGTVDENVYAYSNERGGQRALVLYHNRFGETRGTIHHSTGFIDKSNGGLRQRTVQDALHLPGDHDVILAFRDVSNGLEYLRRASDVQQRGFAFYLQAYKYHVFLHWRELRASREYPWDRLHDSLRGEGVPNLDEALEHLRLEPLHEALRSALDPAVLAKIIDAAEMEASGAIAVRQREQRILAAVAPFIERGNRFHKIAKQLELEHGAVASEAERGQSALLVSTLALPRIEALFPNRWPETARKVLPSDSPGTSGAAVWAPVLAWSLLRGLPLDGVSVFDRLRLRHALADIFQGLGMSGEDGWRGAARVRFLLHRADPLSRELSPREWQEGDVQWLTGTHESEGVRYFNQESHEEFLWWIQIPALVRATPPQQRVAARESAAAVHLARQAARDAGYRVDALLEAELRSTRAGKKGNGASQTGRSAQPKSSSKTNAGAANTRDGAKAAAPAEKSQSAQAKKKTKKRSALSKRKP